MKQKIKKMKLYIDNNYYEELNIYKQNVKIILTELKKQLLNNENIVQSLDNKNNLTITNITNNRIFTPQIIENRNLQMLEVCKNS